MATTVSISLQMFERLNRTLVNARQSMEQTIRTAERLKQSLTTPFVVSLDTMRAQARMAELRERLRNEIISIRLMLDTSKVTAANFGSLIVAFQSKLDVSALQIRLVLNSQQTVKAITELQKKFKLITIQAVFKIPELQTIRAQINQAIKKLGGVNVKVKLIFDTGTVLKEVASFRKKLLARLGTIEVKVGLLLDSSITKVLSELRELLLQLTSQVNKLNSALKQTSSGAADDGSKDDDDDKAQDKPKSVWRSLMPEYKKIAGMYKAIADSMIVKSVLGGAMEQEQMKGSLQAQLGIDSTQAMGMMGRVNDLFTAGWGSSLQTVTNDFAKVRQNLEVLSGDAAEAFLRSAYAVENMSSGATNVNELTKVTRTLMQNFQGLSETEALDLITTGFQKGGNYAGDLMSSINENAKQFAGMGMNAEQMLATLIGGGNSGAASISKVADSVKEGLEQLKGLESISQSTFSALGLDAAKMSGNLAAGGNQANQALLTTLVSLANLEDPLVQGQIGAELFGDKWHQVKMNVMTALEQGQQGMGAFQGAASTAASSLEETFGFQLQSLRRNFSDAFAQAGEGALAVLVPIITQINDAFQAGSIQPYFEAIRIGVEAVTTALAGFYEFVTSNGAVIEPIIMGLVAAFAAWRVIALATAAATMISSIALQVQAALVGGLAGAWKLLNAVLGKNLFIMITAAVIGLIVWLVHLWNTNDQLVAGMYRIWNGLLNFFDQVPIFFAKIFFSILNGFQALKVKALGVIESLANGAIDLINDLVSVFNTIPGFNLDYVQHVSLVADAQAEADRIKQASKDQLDKMKQDAAAKAAQREQDVLDYVKNREDDRAKGSAKEAAERAAQQQDQGNPGAWNAGDSAALPRGAQAGVGALGGIGANASKMATAPESFVDPGRSAKMGASSLQSPDINQVGKVNEVGKINQEVDISDEEIRMMRDLAEMRAIQNFVTLTPTVQVTTGPISKNVDVEEVVRQITTSMETEIGSSTQGLYGF
ncbi:phage-related minor tail protein [Paenibacillus sp. 598K]|uniref:phage tail tape measure protein n=1 Tax=Paenibacillus sp. 598K TaxID=1117987 RepID=UPI000FFA206D|nr:phage tail tape measure protein [Paenibacillus sp. 598K]GBF75766.1 phage-related minor tail protein [Paenibacillus sp. 598K]